MDTEVEFSTLEDVFYRDVKNDLWFKIAENRMNEVKLAVEDKTVQNRLLVDFVYKMCKTC